MILKPFLTAIILTLLDINLNFLPKADLIVVFGISMVLDFITGVIKAVILGRARNSTGYRKTIIKFLQYGGAILIGMGISYMGAKISQYNPSWVNIINYMSWFNTGLLVFIIFIEFVSILENIYALNPKSKFAKYAIKPALHILTIELRKGPFRKLTIETEEEEVDLKQLTEVLEKSPIKTK